MPALTISLTDDEMRGLKALAESQRRNPAQQAAFLVSIGIDAWQEDSREPFIISGSPLDPFRISSPSAEATENFITDSPQTFTEQEMKDEYTRQDEETRRNTEGRSYVESTTPAFSRPTGRTFNIPR